MTISGEVVVAEGQRGKTFSVDATVSWPALAVKGFRPGVPLRGILSSREPPDRPRDSRKLADLLIAEGLTWPYLKGRISLTPEPPWLSWLPESPHNFVHIHFDYDQLSFSDARMLEILDTGFARSIGITRFLHVKIFDRRKLEWALQQRDAISIQLAGNALGSVRYETGYAEEAGDPLGWISQTIKTMSLQMALGKDGLGISVDGELDDFDPIEFAKHREKRNSQLKPLRAYAVQATMPWALLAARGFSFAYRAREF